MGAEGINGLLRPFGNCYQFHYSSLECSFFLIGSDGRRLPIRQLSQLTFKSRSAFTNRGMHFESTWVKHFKIVRMEVLRSNLMWERIRTLFQRYPERLKIAEFILRNGLSIKGDRIWTNEIEVPILKIARVAGVDRRTITQTIRSINTDQQLRIIFSNLESAGPSLRAAAKQLGLGVLEITAEDPSLPGILANASRILATEGISIRQALVDDPELTPNPKLTLIGDRRIPGGVVPLILRVPGISKVSVA